MVIVINEAGAVLTGSIGTTSTIGRSLDKLPVPESCHRQRDITAHYFGTPSNNNIALEYI